MKFRRSKRVRRYRKKRIQRKRRGGFKSKRTSYDGIVFSKCITVGDFTVIGAATCASAVVSWGATGAADAWNYYINNNAEFTSMSAYYDQYKISGVKITIETIAQLTNGAGSGLYSLMRCSDPNQQFTTNPANGDMARKMDYKVYRPTSGGAKMFYNCGKYFSKTNLQQGWLNTGNFYANGSTVCKQECAGFAANAVIGKVQVTWYVRFKSLKV